MRRSFERISALALALGPGAVLRSEEVHSANLITLPPFVVDEQSLDAPTWYHCEAPGLEILSACDRDATVNFVQTFLQRRAELDQFIPQTFLFRTTLPTTLILFPKTLKASMEQEFLQALGSGPENPAAPGQLPSIDDLRLADPDSVYMFVFLDDITTLKPDDITTFRPTDYSALGAQTVAPRPYVTTLRTGVDMMDFPYWDASSFVFSPTYLKFLVSTRAPALPGWFWVGVTRLYESLDYTGPASFRPDAWLSREAAEALHRWALAPRPILPMRELLVATTPDEKSAEYRSIWAAQAELFVRWALSGRIAGGRERLWRFAAAAATQPTTEALFESCFGMNYADARDSLSDFLPLAVKEALRVPSGPEPNLPPINLLEATSEEVHRIKGEWARRALGFAGQLDPKARAVYAVNAGRLLQGAFDKGDRNPRLLASLALFRIGTGDVAGGRAILEENAAACAARPLASIELGRLRLIQALRQPAGPKGAMSDAQAASVLNEIRMALRPGPPVESAYQIAAVVVDHLGREPSADERALLDEGARLFPRDSRLVMETASRVLRAGDVDEARNLIELGLWDCSDPSARRQLARLRDMARSRAAPSS